MILKTTLILFKPLIFFSKFQVTYLVSLLRTIFLQAYLTYPTLLIEQCLINGNQIYKKRQSNLSEQLCKLFFEIYKLPTQIFCWSNHEIDSAMLVWPCLDCRDVGNGWVVWAFSHLTFWKNKELANHDFDQNKIIRKLLIIQI